MQHASPMVHSPSVDTASSIESGTNSRWSSCKSVLDLKVNNAAMLPFQPPVYQYLEEALMGLSGGQHDTKVKGKGQAGMSASFTPDNSLAASRGAESENGHIGPEVRRLMSVLSTVDGAAAEVGNELFWITVGIVFGCVSERALGPFRDALAQNWYLLSLQANKGYPANAEERDWVMQALPYVFAQAVYRLLIDSFEDDRKHFIAQSSSLIEKITVIAAYEVAGFQLTEETIKRMRRRLFMKRVVKNPYVDQREFLRGQKRQEMLEQVLDPTRKLEFGNLDAVALEETQLEHVLQGRAAGLQGRRNQWHGNSSRVGRSPPSGSKGSSPGPSLAGGPNSGGVNAMRAGGAHSEMRVWKPPASLMKSVDQYEELGKRGVEMLTRHLRELQACTGDDGQEDDLLGGNSDSDGENAEDAESIPPGSPYSMASGSFTSWSPRSNDEGTNRKTSADSFEKSARETPQLQLPSFPFRKSKRWKKVSTVAKIMTLLSPHREKREEQAKQQREREQALLKKLSQPLPQNLREREVYTTWVSPVQKRLYPGAADRFVLNKTSAESFRLKMEKTPISARSQSTPALRHRPSDKGAAAKAPGGAQHESASSKDDGGSATGFSGHGGPAGARATHSTGPSSKVVAFEKDADKPPPGGSVPVLPRVASAGNSGIFTLGLEPPQNINSKAVLQRLDLQDRAAEQQSFDHYRKAYDLSTGRPKQRLDAKRLRDDENSIQRKMHDLVGGEPIWVNTRTWKLAAPGASKMQANNLAAYLKRQPPAKSSMMPPSLCVTEEGK